MEEQEGFVVPEIELVRARVDWLEKEWKKKLPRWIDKCATIIDTWLQNYMPAMIERVYERWINEYGRTIYDQHLARAADLSNMRMKQNFLQQKIAILEEEIYQLRRERDGACASTKGI